MFDITKVKVKAALVSNLMNNFLFSPWISLKITIASSSAASNRSISDTDSELHDFHSPLRADSPLRSDDFSSPTSTTIVSVDKYRTPFRSPLCNSEKSSHTINVSLLAKAPSPPAAASYNRSAKTNALTGVDGGINKTRAPVTSIIRKSRSEITTERAVLVCRVCEVVLTLIAFFRDGF